MDVNWIYCGDDHFAIHTCIECCIPKTNVILYFNYISIFEKEGQKSHFQKTESLGIQDKLLPSGTGSVFQKQQLCTAAPDKTGD